VGYLIQVRCCHRQSETELFPDLAARSSDHASISLMVFSKIEGVEHAVALDQVVQFAFPD
jgi:hypothetical protein